MIGVPGGIRRTRSRRMRREASPRFKRTPLIGDSLPGLVNREAQGCNSRLIKIVVSRKAQTLR